MIKVLWDALLSLTIRAIFTAVLFGGLSWLIWTWNESKAYYGDRDSIDAVNMIRMNYGLSVICVLVGSLGTFRRGNVERNFSLVQLAMATGAIAVGGSIHTVGGDGSQGHSLRRFPVFESILLGGALILLWLATLLFGPFRFEPFVFATGAALGTMQIAWGAMVARGAVKKREPIEAEVAS